MSNCSLERKRAGPLDRAEILGDGVSGRTAGSGRQAEFRQSSSYSACVDNAQFDDGVGGEVF